MEENIPPGFIAIPYPHLESMPTLVKASAIVSITPYLSAASNGETWTEIRIPPAHQSDYGCILIAAVPPTVFAGQLSAILTRENLTRSAKHEQAKAASKFYDNTD